MKQFLLQQILDNGEMCSSIKTESEIVEYINLLDCHPVDDYAVYDISEFDNVTRLHYVGWQPNCLIELVDDKNNVVIKGYGEDH